MFLLFGGERIRFYDLHVSPSKGSDDASSLERIATLAHELGYAGIGCVVNFEGRSSITAWKERVRSTSKDTGVEIFLGIVAKNPRELKLLKKLRMEYDLLLVSGGELRLNRLAVETSEVDILAHPEQGKKEDSGMNHVLAKLAAKNSVAIEVNFREALSSDSLRRSLVLSHMRTNVRLAKKYEAPLIISSGATVWHELRDPKFLVSFGNLLGLELHEAKRALSKVPREMIERVRERQSDSWIMPGVKVVGR